MNPNFSINVSDKNVTPIVMDHLTEMRIVTTSDNTSDYLELVLDDREGGLKLPDQGRDIVVALGYGESLSRMGVFIHSQTEYDLNPARLTVRASAADFRNNSNLKAPRTRSFHQITLGELVNQIARENGYIGRCAPELANIKEKHIDQTAESDLHLLRRLANNYDAMFKAAGRHLIFTPAGSGVTAARRRLMPEVRVVPGEPINGRMSIVERNSYNSVKASWHDFNTGNLVYVVAGEGEPQFEIRNARATKQQAEADARARLNRFKRSTAELRLTLSGNPQIVAEGRVKLEGFRDGFNGTWTVTRAVHSLTRLGYRTELVAQPVIEAV